jgi:flagellar motor protein MotB
MAVDGGYTQWESPEPSGHEEHGGPWPALADLFVAATMILLLFFVVIVAGFVQSVSGGNRVRELYRQLDSLARKERTFSVKQVDQDVLIVFEEQVTFRQGEYSLDSLKESAKGTLREISKKVTEDTAFRNLVKEIEVVGHADPKRYTRFGLTNWGLSAARAATVAQFLVDTVGVNPCMIISSGRGEYYPRDPGADTSAQSGPARDFAYSRDRRIEILLHPSAKVRTTPDQVCRRERTQ